MSTPKQTAANRRNAEQSTGPKTEAGKATASLNALRHGILAISEILLPWESRAALDELHAQMIEDWCPRGFMERALVESMVADLWRMRRMQRAEAGVEFNKSLAIAWRRAEEAGTPRKPFSAITFDPAALYAENSRAASQEAPEELSEDVYVYRTTFPDLGEALVEDLKGPDALARIRRYWTSLQNSLYKAMHELERLQARRKGLLLTPLRKAA